MTYTLHPDGSVTLSGVVVPLPGRPYLSWPFRLVDYWHQTRHPVPADFTLHRAGHPATRLHDPEES